MPDTATPDPFGRLRDQLEELPVHPLPAADVRRLGDRRRRRGVTLAAAGAALAVAAVAVPLSLTSTGDRGGVAPATHTPAPTPSRTPAPSPTPTAAIPADFRLDRGWDLAGAPATVSSQPGASDLTELVVGPTTVRLVGPAAAGALYARWSAGGDSGQRRTLVAFGAAAAARAVFDEIHDAVGAAEGAGSGVSLSEVMVAEPDEASFVKFGIVHNGSEGSGYAVYQAGRALLVAEVSEAGGATDRELVDQMAADVGRQARQVVHGLCVFTDSGCAGGGVLDPQRGESPAGTGSRLPDSS
jgi:hypothetical protein